MLLLLATDAPDSDLFEPLLVSDRLEPDLDMSDRLELPLFKSVVTPPLPAAPPTVVQAPSREGLDSPLKRPLLGDLL